LSTTWPSKFDASAVVTVTGVVPAPEVEIEGLELVVLELPHAAARTERAEAMKSAWKRLMAGTLASPNETPMRVP
jgi:hypothetical protein